MARPLRRLILIALGALAGLLLLAGLAVLAFVLFVDADTFRPRIERIASGELGREVRLGRLEWDLGWRLGVASTGGSVAGVPALGEAPLATWRRISLGLAVRPLLRREVLVDEIHIEGLELDLQRAADGSSNWEFEMPEPPGAAGQGNDFRIAVEHVRIEDSTVSFRDAQADARWRLEALDVSLGLEPGPTAMPAAVTTVSLAARVHGTPLPSDGVPVDFEAARIAFDVEGSRLEVPSFTARVDQMHIAGAVELRDAQHAAGRMSLELPSLRGQLARFGVEAPATRDASVFGALRAATDIGYADGALALTQFEARLDDTTLQGQLQLPQLSPLALRFDLTADRADLDRYLEPPEANGEPFELPVAQLESLDARGELRIAEALVAGAVARDVRVTVE